MLLFQFTKKSALINFCAVWILIMQLLDMFVIVLPALHPTGVHFSDLFFGACAVAGIAGMLGWLFLQKIGRTCLFPKRDPRLAGSVFAAYPQYENFLLAAAWWRQGGALKKITRNMTSMRFAMDTMNFACPLTGRMSPYPVVVTV